MPLMSAELLKFPSLSLQYFKTITLVCELYPDKISNLNPELQKNLIASLELGKILFTYDKEVHESMIFGHCALSF